MFFFSFPFSNLELSVYLAAAVGTWSFISLAKLRGDTVLFALFVVWLAHAVSFVVFRSVEWPGAFLISGLHLGAQSGLAILGMIMFRLSPLHPLYDFPGPVLYSTSNLWMARLVSSGTRHTTIQAFHRKYGKFVRIGPNSLSINSHTAVNAIYGSAKAMDRSAAYRLQPLPGAGLFFTLNRDVHHTRRNVWGRAFSPANLDYLQPILNRRTAELSECIQQRARHDGVVNLSRCIEDWSFDFMGDFAFGPQNSFVRNISVSFAPLTFFQELMRDGDAEDLVKNGKTATALFDIFGVIPWFLDIMWYLPNTQSIKRLHSLSRKLLAHRKTLPMNEDDQDLSCFLLASGDASEKLTDDEMTMDLIFAIQAGSDTTANVLQYIFFFLISHPTVYTRLSAELEAAFPTAGTFLDFRTLEDLPYLNAVVNEGLRMGTPLSGLERMTPANGCAIDDKFLPGNTIVSVPAFTQQLDPSNFFPHPEQYLPERWLPGGLGEGSILEPSAIMSFSFGPYGCLGRTLAFQELRLVVARLMLDFNMEPTSDFDPNAYGRNIRNIRTTFFPDALFVKLKSKASD